jgi:RNA polymerase-binding transcription factor DksA
MNAALPPRQHLHARPRLLEERAAKLHEAAEPIEPHGTHLADSATDEFDHDLALVLLAREEHALREVQEAIYRILSGTYGICEMTKKPIPARRLRAVPWCRYARTSEEVLEQAGAVSAPRVPSVHSIRGYAADIPYTGDIPREGMEMEPVEHEEPKAGKALVDPVRTETENE